jgi:hypothetical protein
MTNIILLEVGRSGLGVMKKVQAFKMDLHRASTMMDGKVKLNEVAS